MAKVKIPAGTKGEVPNLKKAASKKTTTRSGSIKGAANSGGKP